MLEDALAEDALLTDKPEPGIPEWKLVIYGRAVTGSGQRKKPSTAQREAILIRQGNRCLYCDLKIGSIVWRGVYNVQLHANWDHFVPYAYGQTNGGSNWVLACHVCNGIKGCRMFDSVIEAQEYIKERWAKKGYQLPLLPSMDDPDNVNSIVEPEPEPEPEEPEPSYAPVPLELAKAAKIVCRRLADEMRPVPMSRVMIGGNQTMLRAALMALIESGHVKRRPRKGLNRFDYWLARPYEIPREAQHLPEFTWKGGGLGLVKSPRHARRSQAQVVAVRPGQVWGNRDTASRGRTFRVDRVDNRCAYGVVLTGAGGVPASTIRRVEVSLDRMRPIGGDFRLVQDVPTESEGDPQ